MSEEKIEGGIYKKIGRPKINNSAKWQRVYRFIRAYYALHGVTPSYDVMTKALGLKAKSNLHRIVKRLEEVGMVETSRKNYGIKLK